MKDLSNYRRSYERGQLDKTEVPASPVELFEHWFVQAEKESPAHEANAMTLSTASSDGVPTARIVLLKHYSDQGFVFFTNYNSNKGKAIAENPNVCLSFFWPFLERQVIIKGVASKTEETVSDAYFNSRPRGSRLGAIASEQSSETTREELEAKLLDMEFKYPGDDIPRPAHWGGYIVVPTEIEFWQGRANRLHDRILYRRDGTHWQIHRLAP